MVRKRLIGRGKNPVKTAVGAVVTCGAVGGYASSYFSAESRIKRAMDAGDKATVRSLLEPIAKRVHMQGLRDRAVIEMGLYEDKKRPDDMLLFHIDMYARKKPVAEMSADERAMKELIRDIWVENNIYTEGLKDTLAEALPRFAYDYFGRYEMVDMASEDEYELIKALAGPKFGVDHVYRMRDVLHRFKNRWDQCANDSCRSFYSRLFTHMIARVFDLLVDGHRGKKSDRKPTLMATLVDEGLPLGIDVTDISGLARMLKSLAPKEDDIYYDDREKRDYAAHFKVIKNTRVFDRLDAAQKEALTQELSESVPK